LADRPRLRNADHGGTANIILLKDMNFRRNGIERMCYEHHSGLPVIAGRTLRHRNTGVRESSRVCHSAARTDVNLVVSTERKAILFGLARKEVDGD